jgi:hypothetical protein
MVTRKLCLGNNTELTDQQARKLAAAQGTICHGLLSELDVEIANYSVDGFYHSSVYDIMPEKLREICLDIGHVIVLPQTKSDYQDPESFYQTVQLCKQLESTITVDWLDPEIKNTNQFFEQLVNTNDSFCIYPFIELLVQDGSTTVCCRSYNPITKLSQLTDYKTDPGYTAIRDKMLQGVRVPEHCSACYKLENVGITSPRKQETIEWANRLGLDSLEDLQKITQPVYYEIRPSNICNLQCRMCSPTSSHLIDQEYQRLGLSSPIKIEHTGFDIVDINNVDKLYVAGGEPMAMPEFYEFVDQCIGTHKTDFEFVINTNGTKLSDRFKRQLQHFSRMQFIVSIDGADQLNHYIRWPSNWSTIVDNVNYLVTNSYYVTFNVTVSMYNVLDLNNLFRFFEQHWPRQAVHLQLAGSRGDYLSAFNHPSSDLVVDMLTQSQQSATYRNNALVANFVDTMLDHYKNDHQCDLVKLKKFFDINDKLDESRNIYLEDYLPELAKFRIMI